MPFNFRHEDSAGASEWSFPEKIVAILPVHDRQVLMNAAHTWNLRPFPHPEELIGGFLVISQWSGKFLASLVAHPVAIHLAARMEADRHEAGAPVSRGPR